MCIGCGVAFFCIYLHLFAFFCIAFFVISICIFSPPAQERQCGHTGSTGRPGKNVKTPPVLHIHVHTRTQVERHANLPNAWEQFKTGIQDGQRKLNGWKEKFKIDLEQEIKSFDKSAAALLDEWRARGPYEADMGIEKAQGTIAEYRQKLAQKREKESSLRVGMDIFTIDKPPYKELQDLSGSLDQFETMWKLTEGWNQAWEQWKTNSFQVWGGRG